MQLKYIFDFMMRCAFGRIFVYAYKSTLHGKLTPPTREVKTGKSISVSESALEDVDSVRAVVSTATAVEKHL